jgi:hypothetical protein
MHIPARFGGADGEVEAEPLDRFRAEVLSDWD